MLSGVLEGVFCYIHFHFLTFWQNPKPRQMGVLASIYRCYRKIRESKKRSVTDLNRCTSFCRALPNRSANRPVERAANIVHFFMFQIVRNFFFIFVCTFSRTLNLSCSQKSHTARFLYFKKVFLL